MDSTENNFEPTDDVISILETLRSVQLGWIADEIEEEIRTGRAVRRGRATRGEGSEQIVPYEADFQERIVIRSLRNYFHGTFSIHVNLDSEYRELLGNENLHLAIVQATDDQVITYFSEDYAQEIVRFDQLLREAWPQGNERFDEGESEKGRQ